MQQEIKYGQLWARHSKLVEANQVGNYRISFEGMKRAVEEVLRMQHPAGGNVWVKADTKPEYNVGVLVFIPGEDNHVTSGMWDIDNKWVLLDEYRVPDCEVTHWMELPSFPEGFPDNEIPSEIASALKEIAKEELKNRKQRSPNEQPVEQKENEVALLRWLREEGWEPRNHTGWAKHADNESYYLTDKEIWNEWNNAQKK